MADLKFTLAKARRELEDLYLGVPDESVNLTFQDLADVKQKVISPDKKNKPNTNPVDAVPEANPKEGPKEGPPLTKLPSLDFNRGWQRHDHHHHYLTDGTTQVVDSPRGRPPHHLHSTSISPRRINGAFRSRAVETNMAYDEDMSHISMASTTSYQQRGGRRRPGIPHSSICTVCSVYIYIFRHRCLVCGRVYCRQCVSIGMGEMTEGRKCTECLGKRFSQRYIQRAGKIGWCSRYPSTVKQQELKWAEKGPRRSGERGYGPSVLMSRSRSPIGPTIPTTPHASSTPSFVVNSPYSPYSPTGHSMPMPF